MFVKYNFNKAFSFLWLVKYDIKINIWIIVVFLKQCCQKVRFSRNKAIDLSRKRTKTIVYMDVLQLWQRYVKLINLFSCLVAFMSYQNHVKSCYNLFLLIMLFYTKLLYWTEVSIIQYSHFSIVQYFRGPGCSTEWYWTLFSTTQYFFLLNFCLRCKIILIALPYIYEQCKVTKKNLNS
jgi:hypothetical protein